MKKKMITALAAACVGISLAACSGDTEEEGVIIEGRYAFSHHASADLHMFFAGDNVAGEDYREFQHEQDMEFDDYEAEAYLLHITEATELIDGETGEEIIVQDDFISPFEYPNQRIEVEFSSGFEREMLSRDDHISFDPALFPVAEAERIKIFDYKPEDYIRFLQPLQETSYIYMATGDNPDYPPYIYQIFHKINEETDYYFTFTNSNPHSYSFMDSDGEDEHLIISADGIVHKSTDRGEAEAFIEGLIGTEFPDDEADPMEWEIN